MLRILLACFLMTMLWAVPCPAQNRIHHMMLHDPAPAPGALPAFEGVAGEVAEDGNAVLWWLDARTKHSVESVAFEDPETKTALPARTEMLGAPLNCYALMIDDSLSMRPFMAAAQASMKAVLGLVPDNERVGLYRFSEDLVPVRPLTVSRELTDGEEAIDGIRLVGKDTQLYLALLKVMDDLARCPAVRGHVIVFSDGDAEDRARTLQEALERARRQRVAIHAVGFAPAGQAGTALKMEVLRTLSEETMGRYHFYESAEALAQAFTEEFPLHATAGVALPLDLQTLEYGRDRLDLVITTRDSDGVEHVFRLPVSVKGTTTWDNALVTISARSFGLNPRLVLAAPPAFLFLVMVLILVLRTRRRKRRAQLEAARQQAEAERLEQMKVQEEQREARVQMAFEQVNRKLDEFQPAEKVMERGEAYGRLVELDGPTHDLFTYSTRIGRSPENDVILSDPHVSSEHAILDFKRGKFIWTDRAPMNSTSVNDRPVQGSAEINPGDIILCGETRLRFELSLVE